MTNTNAPLRIAELEAGGNQGRIGITFAPGKKQVSAFSGRHVRDLGTDLDVIAAWNAAAVVTLIEQHELEALQIPHLGAEVRRRFMEWHHWPIVDVSVPDAAFEADWPQNSVRLRGLLEAGGRLLIHCKGGLGRAGTIAARLLVETGVPPADAIAQVRAVRPGAIETRAQERWVERGSASTPPKHLSPEAARRDRALGALIGLAVGDAVGTTLEFKSKPREPLIDDLVGGGPFRLKRGQWTDDTAMALALADSLLADPTLDPGDLMSRFVDWHENGTYSCTGVCFDIGNTTRAALSHYKRTGEVLAGSTDPDSAANGALMRLSPVAVRHWSDRPTLRRVAGTQTRTTHGAAEAVEASLIFAELLADAIEGMPLPTILGTPAADRIKGGWRGLHRNAVRGSGYVVHSLQAAVWAVSRTASFRSAILLAANLGEDADTTAAIAGQLAGAVYGCSGIPAEWLAHLAWRDRIEGVATKLYVAGEPSCRERMRA
jgi:ADP-ribosyl-[dinitrogen reductase] hydrolase